MSTVTTRNATPGQSDAREHCDLLVFGSLVMTCDEDDRTIAHGAVAIRGNRIAAIGTQDELAARFEAVETIDAGNQLVMPGFINSHNHTPLMIVRGMIEDRNFAPAYTRSLPNVHALSEEETHALSRAGAYELLRGGITTAVDFYRHPRALVAAADEVGLRAVISGRIHDADTAELAQGHYVHKREIGDATLRETLDLIADGERRDNDRIRFDFGPHAADTCSRALLAEVAALAAKRPCNIHTHLAQSQKEVDHVLARDGMLPHRLFADVGLLDERMIAAHCVFLEDEAIAEVGASGMAVAHAPHQNARVGNIAPVRDLADAGARITLCTDTRSADMFEAMRLAVASARIRRKELEPKSRKALSWVLSEPAAALRLPGVSGMLREGDKADVILIDLDSPNLVPFVEGPGMLVHSGQSLNVDTVIVDGRVRLRERKPVGFDGRDIVREAQRVGARLWKAQGIESPITEPA